MTAGTVIYQDAVSGRTYLDRYTRLMSDDANTLRIGAVLESVPRHLPKGTRVLDVACGGGGYLKRLREERRLTGGWSCVLDLSMACVQGCRLNMSDVLPTVGNVVRLPFPDATFDLVLALDIVEHIAEDSVFVQEVARVLAPGGYAVLSTQNALSVQYVVGALAAAIRRRPWTGWDPNHLRFYTWRSLGQVLGAAGLTPVTFNGTYYVPFHIASRSLGALLRLAGIDRVADVVERTARTALRMVNALFERSSLRYPWSLCGWGLIVVARRAA